MPGLCPCMAIAFQATYIPWMQEVPFNALAAACAAGAMVSLQRRWPAANRVGAQWANASRPLGRFLYSTYTEADYDVIWDEYLYIDRTVWWITKDLGKSNCSSAGPVRSDTPAAAQGFWVKQVGGLAHVGALPHACCAGGTAVRAVLMHTGGCWLCLPEASMALPDCLLCGSFP